MFKGRLTLVNTFSCLCKAIECNYSKNIFDVKKGEPKKVQVTERLRIIKYFLRHSFYQVNNNNTQREHLLCYVTWKQKHPMCNWFGKSAIVSSTLNEVESGCQSNAWHLGVLVVSYLLTLHISLNMFS